MGPFASFVFFLNFLGFCILVWKVLGQVRWPEETPDLTLNLPGFFVCFFVCVLFVVLSLFVFAFCSGRFRVRWGHLTRPKNLFVCMIFYFLLVFCCVSLILFCSCSLGYACCFGFCLCRKTLFFLQFRFFWCNVFLANLFFHSVWDLVFVVVLVSS